MKWGLVPAGSPDGAGGARLINARSETVRDLPSFRLQFEHRRCLVPTDGFYEWRRMGRGRQPVHFRRPDHGLLAFAGIWDRWIGEDTGDADPLETFSILTTEPNTLVRSVHDRMPVLLSRRHYDVWLDPHASVDRLLALTGPTPDGVLEAVEVNPVVNGTGFDGPECLEPPPPPVELDLFG